MGRKIFEEFMAESFSQWIQDIKPQIVEDIQN